MLQAHAVTVWSGLSVTGTHNSDPFPTQGADFCRVFVSVNIQSFTYVEIRLDLMDTEANWKPVFDPFQNATAQRFTANFTGCMHYGAFSTLSAQRASQLSLCRTIARFRCLVSGASGTPGTLSVTAQFFNRRAGAYQTR